MSRSRVLTQAFAAAALALSAGLVSTVASAAEPEVISGTVTSAGVPIAGISVAAFQWDGDRYSQNARVTTDSDGHFIMDDFTFSTDGMQRLQFIDFQGRYFDEYYNNVDSIDQATDLDLGDGISNTGIDADLDRAGRITGRVTDEQGSPLAGIQINANGPSGSTAYTDALGRYSLGRLEGGDYEIGFFDSTQTYAHEYWDDQPNFPTANLVSVPAHQSVTLHDTQLTRAGALSGVLTDVTGAGVYDNGALAYLWDSTLNDWVYADYTDSNESGSYRFPDLRPGTYRVCFLDGSDRQPALADECWDNATNLATATSVTVTAATETTGISAELATTPPTGTPTIPPTTPPTTPPVTTPPVTTPPVTTPPVTTPPVTTPPVTQPTPPAPSTVKATAAVLAEFLAGAKARGTLKVGKTVKVAIPSKPGVAATIQWLSAKKVIKKASKTRLKLTSAFKGKTVSVKVTAVSGGVTKTRIIQLGKVR